MKNVLLVIVLALSACDVPTTDLPATDTVAVIKNAHIWPTRKAKITIKLHYNYHPEADNDLVTTAGQAEVYPTILPQELPNHNANRWYGFSDIQQISPIQQVAWSAFTQKNNADTGWKTEVGYGTVGCLPTVGPADNISGVGLSAVDCTMETPIFDMVNETIFVQWTPVCRNGNLGNGWITEAVFGFGDDRLKSYTLPGYPDGANIVITANHGSPFFDRAYWQTMAQNCQAAPSMWSHPGAWTHPIWRLQCFLSGCYPFMAWLGGPHNWN